MNSHDTTSATVLRFPPAERPIPCNPLRFNKPLPENVVELFWLKRARRVEAAKASARTMYRSPELALLSALIWVQADRERVFADLVNSLSVGSTDEREQALGWVLILQEALNAGGRSC